MIRLVSVLAFLTVAGALSALLATQGLDDTEKWFSIAGVLISVTLAALSWVRGRDSSADTGVVAGTGSVHVGGDNHGQISTNITASSDSTPAQPKTGRSGLHLGPGAVQIGGSNHRTGVIRTNIDRKDPGAST